MPFKRRTNATLSPLSSQKKGKLSHKRLQTMINKNQGLDIGLENYEQVSLDNLDLRTEQERTALLLWVCILQCPQLVLSLI